MNRWRWMLVLLLLIILLATGLRAFRLDAQSLWYDEGSSLSNALSTPAQIWLRAAGDIHPPGYYVALAGWVRLFGQSEVALRSLSLVSGVLLVPITFAVGRQLFNPVVGFIAAALIVINPFLIYYSQETRMYMPLALLSGLSLMLFLRWLDGVGAQRAVPRARHAAPLHRLGIGHSLILIALVLTNAAGLYTHYFFPFFLLVESLLFAAWWLFESDKPLRWSVLGQWVALNLASLLLFAPWLPTAQAQLSGYPRQPLAIALDQGLLRLGALLTYGNTLPLENSLQGLAALGLLAVVGLFPPVEGESNTENEASGKPSHTWRMGLVLAWLLIPTAAMFLFKLYRPQLLKFMLPAAIAPALLLARGIWMGFKLARPGGLGAIRGGWLMIIIAALATLGLAPTVQALNNLYFDPAYARDNYRALASYLQAASGPDEAIILTGPAQIDVFSYYYPSRSNLYPLPQGQTENQLESILTNSQRVYVVFYGEDERDPRNLIESTLDRRAFEAETRWYGDVRLVTYGVSETSSNQPTTSLDARFGPNIRLLGYSIDTQQLRPGGLLNITLDWQATSQPAESYIIFIHLSPLEGGVPLAQHDGAPVGGSLLTNMWTPGQTIQDNHGLLIPLDLPPGDYNLLVGMYGADGVRLPVTLNDSDTSDSLPLHTISTK